MRKILICGPCTEDRIDGASYFGGAGGGIALNLASLKIPTGLISVLGEDDFSNKYEDKLQQLHVPLTLVSKTDHIPVMTLINKNNSESARDYNPYKAKEALQNLRPTQSKLIPYDFLHVVNTPKELADYLADNFSGTISYCPGSLLVRDPKSLSLNLLRKATYLFCNEEEYTILESLIDIQRLFLEKLKYVFLTKGEKGIDITKKEETKLIPTIPVEQIVDTTGAGDAIVVGFITGLFENKTINYSIQLGQSFASRIIQKNGVIL